MPKSRAQQPNRKPPAGAPSKGFQSSFVEPLNAPQSKRARIHPTEHSARNHPWSDLGSSFTPRQSPGYTDNNPTAPKQTPLSRLNPTPTLPNNSNTWPDAPSSSTKANSQTQHSQWPMTALPKPALSSSLSVLHPDLVEHPTSPLQSGKHRDRRPATNFRQLAAEVIQRQQTEWSLWSHTFTRALASAQSDHDQILETPAMQQLLNAAKLRVTQVFTPSASNTLLIRATLLPSHPQHTPTSASGSSQPLLVKHSSEGPKFVVFLKNSTHSVLAQCRLEHGITASIMPSLRDDQDAIQIGDEVWLLDWMDVLLCSDNDQRALLSHKFATIHHDPSP